jgi:hypothetical protein
VCNEGVHNRQGTVGASCPWDGAERWKPSTPGLGVGDCVWGSAAVAC